MAEATMTGSLEIYRMGFLDGFKMAMNNSRLNAYIEPAEMSQYNDSSDQLTAMGIHGDMFVTVIQNGNGKRLRFNKRSAALLGDYKRADIYVKNGNIYIYPSNEGRYAITRAPSSGAVQICCSSIIDELSADGNRYWVQPKDNHLVAVKAV